MNRSPSAQAISHEFLDRALLHCRDDILRGCVEAIAACRAAARNATDMADAIAAPFASMPCTFGGAKELVTKANSLAVDCEAMAEALTLYLLLIKRSEPLVRSMRESRQSAQQDFAAGFPQQANEGGDLGQQ